MSLCSVSIISLGINIQRKHGGMSVKQIFLNYNHYIVGLLNQPTNINTSALPTLLIIDYLLNLW